MSYAVEVCYISECSEDALVCSLLFFLMHKQRSHPSAQKRSSLATFDNDLVWYTV